MLGPGAFSVGWTVYLDLHHLACSLLEVFQKSVTDFYFNSSLVEEHSWVCSHLLRLVSCLKHEFVFMLFAHLSLHSYLARRVL